jgi:hypothetical protein
MYDRGIGQSGARSTEFADGRKHGLGPVTHGEDDLLARRRRHESGANATGTLVAPQHVTSFSP